LHKAATNGREKINQPTKEMIAMKFLPSICCLTKFAIAFTSCLLLFIAPQAALAQRDAPVWECYLPKIEIYHEDDSKLSIDLLFKKNGGPYEHIEHQCYILAYLVGDEAEIMKLAADKELIKKKENKTPLIDVLVEKKLVTILESKAVKLKSPDGLTQKFPDVTGNPAQNSKSKIDHYTFPFQFTFKYQALFDARKQLGNFKKDDANQLDNQIWYKSNIKLLVFVPVNDTKYSDKVSADIRDKHDFAYSMNTETILLYFKPLSYEISFKKYDDKLLLYIH
jgi:hypothetical protein